MNFKKILSIVLSALMLSMAFTICVGAAQTTVNSVTYELDSTTLTAKVVSVGNTATITIPATVSTSYKVTEIADNAGKDNGTITTLNLSGAANLEKIGKNAFSYCDKLATVSFPTTSKISYIASNAFYYCNSLATVNNDASQTSISEIGSGVFGITPYVSNNSATLVTFGNVLLRYNGNATAVTGLNSSGITAIADAFAGKKLISIDLTGIKCVGNNAFYNCRELKNVTLPNCVKVGDMAFSGCNALTGVTYGTALREIGFCAFSNCPNLSSFSASGTSNLEKIGNFAFWNCTSLASANVGKSIVFGTGAFSNTAPALSFALPSTLLRVGTGAYKNIPYDFSTLAGAKNMASMLAKKITPASTTGATEDQKYYADFNGDGEINLLDLYTAMKSIKKAKTTLG